MSGKKQQLRIQLEEPGVPTTDTAFLATDAAASGRPAAVRGVSSADLSAGGSLRKTSRYADLQTATTPRMFQLRRREPRVPTLSQCRNSASAATFTDAEAAASANDVRNFKELREC